MLNRVYELGGLEFDGGDASSLFLSVVDECHWVGSHRISFAPLVMGLHSGPWKSQSTLAHRKAVDDECGVCNAEQMGSASEAALIKDVNTLSMQPFHWSREVWIDPEG